MTKKILKKVALLFISLNLYVVLAAASKDLITIKEQGSFAVGGKVTIAPGIFDSKNNLDNPYKSYPEAGQTNSGDHAYVFYQRPVNERKYPIVFLHGGGQSGKSWETTPDGREGFQNIFLRKRYGVYIVDQPRRGRAGKSSVDTPESKIFHSEQFLFNFFRIGLWPEYFKGVQFSRDKEALKQYYRQVTPNTAGFDENVVSDAMSALFDKIGQGILVGHSQGSGPVLQTAIKNRNVKGIVIYEPGAASLFVPKGKTINLGNGEMPDSLPQKEVSEKEFKELTRIPIIIYFGDNIPTRKGNHNPILEEWRRRVNLTREWAELVNRNGGRTKVVVLPEIGVKGNTHFPFSDLNNLQIADLMEQWLKENKLD